MLKNILSRPVSCIRILQLNASALSKVRQAAIPEQRLYSSSSTTTVDNKWDLYAGVLVERLPIVSKELNDREKIFQELLHRIEYENSLKSDHELKHEKDLIQAELIKKGKVEPDLDDTTSKQTAQDLEDAYKEELKAFKTAPRKTADDTKNNTSSTNRCLDDTLYLVVEQKLGEKSHLLLPQGVRMEGETMRQTAERVLREKCGEDLMVDFYGHAPCGFYKYKYPSAARTASVGAKVFFFRAILRQGNCNKTIAKKYEWLPRNLLDNKLSNPSYTESIQKFLF